MIAGAQAGRGVTRVLYIAYGAWYPCRMTTRWRRVIFGVGAFAAALVTLVTAEQYTAQRKIEAFSRRVSVSAEGMTESEVRSVAGAPERFVPDVPAEPDLLEGCGTAKGTGAMIYSVRTAGWLQTRLEIVAGVISRVVCLDANRRVVRIYARYIDY